jgi:50S ribosomal subunit-associated GTPase HflX
MSRSKADIEEARRLAKQAEGQVASQLEMIERMKRSSPSTAIAEEALQTMRRISEQMDASLKNMIGPAKGD